jgi:hypothetical protein
MQGLHQLAQKSITRYLALKERIAIALPAVSLKLNIKIHAFGFTLPFLTNKYQTCIILQ